MLFAGFAGLLFWFIVAFTVVTIVRQQIALRRRAILSALIRTMQCGAPLPAMLAAYPRDTGQWFSHKVERLAQCLEQGLSLPQGTPDRTTEWMVQRLEDFDAGDPLHPLIAAAIGQRQPRRVAMAGRQRLAADVSCEDSAA